MILEDTKKKILKRLYVAVILLLVVSVLIFIQIFNIQYVEGEHYREIVQEKTIKNHIVKPRRGNIYSEGGSLLATSVTKYNVSIDPSVISDKVFDENIDGLSDSIYRVFGAKTKYYYADLIANAKKKGKRYLRLKKNLSFDDYRRLKNFPILNKGRFKGGLIVEEVMVREHPFGKVAERTIGYEKDFGSVGLEGAYSKYLSGSNGRVLSVKLQKGLWKPLSDSNEIEPEDGADIYSTIDVHIQDVAHYALLRQLEKYDADHGTVVVMEVKTGKIKGIVNLGRTDNGKYFEKVNYAVYESAEPGSTFKLPALIAALEDGVVDTSKVIDTGRGSYKIYNKTIKDAHRGGFGKISIKRVFEESSNIGMAKIINTNYKNNPKKFLRRLYTMRLDKKTGVNIKGEGEPIIPNPSIDGWSGLSLAWMAHGYGVHMTPLQILTFYNAIANDGVEVKPYFVSRVKDDKGEIYSVSTKILNPRICSEENVKIAQDLLKGVVENGTGQALKMESLKIAGKTGTTQLNYWEGKDNVSYSSSFVGYFPAGKPKYSMIVVVNKPDKLMGYYGSQVAAPIFKEIAVKIYRGGPELKHSHVSLTDKSLLRQIEVQKTTRKTRKGLMPNVKGMPAMDALSVLENIGLKVRLYGYGKVKEQSIKSGERVKYNDYVNLMLK